MNKGQGASQNEIWSQRIPYVLTHFIHWFSAHWLLLANVVLFLYVGLPFLAPVLMYTGHERLARAIYLLFRPLCHQLPERSFFLFGPRWVYSYAQLSHALGGNVPRRFIGNQALGFKVAICERDVVIYGTMFLGGLFFSFVRRRLAPLRLKAFVGLIIPMAIDGTGQLLGLWTSTWWSRILTGSLFGLACIWLAYPYLETGMREIHIQASKTLREWEDT